MCDETTFSQLLAGDTWWSVQRHNAQLQNDSGVVDAAIRSAAKCDARMLLRVQEPRWYWGPVSCSRIAAALLRRATDDGRVAFVAHEFLVDPARHCGVDSNVPLARDHLDLVRHRPFLDIEIEVPLLSRALADTLRTSPNEYISLLDRCYVEAFREAFGLEPHCLWLSSHVFDAESQVRKASFHVVVDTATRCSDSSIHHVCFQRCSAQRAFVARFEPRLARMLFVEENWSSHDVDRVVPFVHAACTVVESAAVAIAEQPPKPWIDSGVYAPKHSMRLPLASKAYDVLRPMMPLNFAVDNADGKGGIEAACITGFDVDGAIVLDEFNSICAEEENASGSRADQCRAVLGALATSMSRLVGSFAAAARGDELESLQPFLLAHRECEDCLRLFLARADSESETVQRCAAVGNLLALDSVLSRLKKLTCGFQAWCDERSVQRVSRPAAPLPFANDSDRVDTDRCGSSGTMERCAVSYEQKQYEWPIVLELATEHLRVEATRVRLCETILWRNGARGSTVASYIAETRSGAPWYCLVHERQHERRKFRININQQTGVCVLRCDGDTCKPLDEIVSFAMQQCSALGNAPAMASRSKRARFSPPPE